ncbi:hypothetical protein, partial [Acinetobacter ursingii]|uniref:hypothetical protein n=1 Tax=Acinetobacter ursingii TaxID=108980 RepID=UPI001BC89740
AFKISELDSLVPRQDKKTSTSPEKFTYDIPKSKFSLSFGFYHIKNEISDSKLKFSKAVSI